MLRATEITRLYVSESAALRRWSGVCLHSRKSRGSGSVDKHAVSYRTVVRSAPHRTVTCRRSRSISSTTWPSRRSVARAASARESTSIPRTGASADGLGYHPCELYASKPSADDSAPLSTA